MIVPKEIKEKWEALRSHTDAKKIADEGGFSYETIRIALASGECTDQIFDVIANFYKAKEERVKEYL